MSELYNVFRHCWQGLIEPVLAAVAMKLYDVLDSFGIHLQHARTSLFKNCSSSCSSWSSISVKGNCLGKLLVQSFVAQRERSIQKLQDV
jgi:hypothetical protein